MKYVCPNCRTLVDTEATDGKCKCPSCNTSFNAEQGRSLLAQQFALLTNRAYKKMTSKQDYEGAYKDYKTCLNLKENDFASITNMILCKIYGSSFDDLKYSDIVSTINEYEIALDSENTFIFMSFISDIIHQTKYFLKASKKYLTENEVFINQQYLDYYINGLKQLEGVFNFFDESIGLADEGRVKEFKENNVDFEKNYEDTKNSIKSALNSNYNVSKVGDVELDDGVVSILGNNIKETSVDKIEDLSIIPLNQKANKIKNIMIGVFAVIFVVMIVFLIVYMVTKNFLFLYLEIIPVVLLVVAFLVFKFLFNKAFK